ncbi:hypothetical protein NDU88_003542 [Pleurodeles waltl]|uniref:Uncharacterized protein n=1 Tax=Pleurodeles waltl TaxID=8319 RepID=A0AAV7SDS0_PLEWA|nr:hypothetical protein NDU88_003542 [Pleurodeles waltl]
MFERTCELAFVESICAESMRCPKPAVTMRNEELLLRKTPGFAIEVVPGSCVIRGASGVVPSGRCKSILLPPQEALESEGGAHDVRAVLRAELGVVSQELAFALLLVCFHSQLSTREWVPQSAREYRAAAAEAGRVTRRALDTTGLQGASGILVLRPAFSLTLL